MGFSYLRGITSVEKLENRVMRAVLLRRRLREALVALQTGENLQGSAVPQRQELGSGACVYKESRRIFTACKVQRLALLAVQARNLSWVQDEAKAAEG